MASSIELADLILSGRSGSNNSSPLSSVCRELDLSQAREIQRLVAIGNQAQTKMLGYRVFSEHAGGAASIGLDVPALGLVTSAMMVDDADTVRLESLVHPRVSGAIAVLIGRDIRGSVPGLADLVDSVDLVFPAIDVSERPYHQASPTLLDVVSANALGRYVVLGDGGRSPADFDLECCGVVLELDGELVASGAGAAILGHPINALSWLAHSLEEFGEVLTAGTMVVLTDLTPSIAISAGCSARLAIGGLGSAGVRFT